MNLQRTHIQRLLTFALLWVFSLAITPWTALHHHPEVEETIEHNCTHKLHIKTSADNCLVCKAHFEKNYALSRRVHLSVLPEITVKRDIIQETQSYVALIATALRGPPVSLLNSLS